ncbi:MAG: class II fructose-bisphosphate aldolase [Candidatus Pacebacteria bacterium]|nr:class II fructose-bisphosphate aldolase [Candidatus Paceibacterota bacterium]
MNFRDYIIEAQKEKWAIGQFNISNLETLKAIVAAAQKLKSPIIIGTSENESKFLGLEETVALISAVRKKSGLPIILNLDHGKTLDYIKEAVSLGYDAVHFDGSKLSLAENIDITKKVVEFAYRKKVLVEGEVGIIFGSSELHEEKIEVKKEDLTDPEKALKFINETKVDTLAVNVGTFHGLETTGEKHVNIKRLKEIKNKVKNQFLVLHGGSGIPEKDIKEAVRGGIVKININTELRLAFTEGLKKSFSEDSKESVPYKYMPEVISGIQKVVEEKIKLFGSNNKIK